VDGSLTPACARPSGATFPLGVTTVRCSAADAHGNTGSATFTIRVVDTTPPSLTVPADIISEATGPGGAAVPFSVGATDIVDGPVAATCSPSSGFVFPLGATRVDCTATDGHGNVATATFTVTVRDTTAPLVTVPVSMSLEATGPGGALATFTASATDTVDGPLSASCSLPSGSTFPLGVTSVTCSATDAHGNLGFASFTITVHDTTPPALVLPGAFSVEATSSSGAAVTYSVSASDIVDGVLVPACAPASGSMFPLGTTTVHCSDRDRSILDLGRGHRSDGGRRHVLLVGFGYRRRLRDGFMLSDVRIHLPARHESRHLHGHRLGRQHGSGHFRSECR